MRVLLVSANTERINMVTVPLGLGLVAAATRSAGHEVQFLDLLGKTDPPAAVQQAVLAFRPDVVGISVRNIDDQCAQAPRFLLEPARAVVQACKAASQAPVVVGGAGFSLFPREALAYLGADFGVAGDGEQAFPALLDHLSRGAGARPDLPGVWSRDAAPSVARAHEVDLATCAGWDEVLDIVARGPDLWVPVQGRRGCPNDCSYCSTSLVQGRRIRCRPPADVAATVQRLADDGVRHVYFVDNSFNIPEAWALELCERLKKVEPKIEWRAILYPERVRPELVDAMAAAGCVEVSLGFESGIDSILKSMNKRFTTRDVRETSEFLRSRGIRRMGFLLFGGPGETRETVEQSLAFARELKLDGLRTTVGIRIYPGTALARTALAEGLIASEDDLLQPKFYLAPGLEPWIHERLAVAA
ncbi:MAG TPA: radical SAM protein [Myxococcales bacterium]|jgi:radical SAM superfamily enzyme YgiQ (UPF0313 family)